MYWGFFILRNYREIKEDMYNNLSNLKINNKEIVS